MTFGLALPFFLLLWSYLYWLWGSVAQLPAGSWPALLTGVLTLGVFCLLLRRNFFQTKRHFMGGDVAVFVICFVGGLLLRSWMSTLDQTEKFPDLAMLQAATLDRRFPPIDRFLSGETLNYYYFGYLLFSPLLQVLHIPLEWGFNLAVVLVFSMLASGAYALVRELGANRFAACGSALALTFGSNWEWIRQVLTKGKVVSWWDSSRVIPGTINEFPFFSFLVGDLHAHYMELPWLSVAAFALFSLRKDLARNERNWRRVAIGISLAAICVGVHYPLNPWGVPFLGLLALVWIGRWPLALMAVGVGSFLSFLPYWLSYERPVSSVAWVPWGQRSTPILFLLHWAPFVTLLLTMLPILKREKWNPKLWPVEGRLVGLSLFLIGLCEVIYFRDAFSGGEFFRINTVFKFYLVAWWGLAISVPVLLSKYWKEIPGSAQLKKGIVACTLAASLVYPVFGTGARLGWHLPPPTLDGMAYWSQLFPGEREVVNWIRRSTSSQDVIWEVEGPAYQHFGRIAAFSGRATVLAWANHQWVWRQDGHQKSQEREEDLKRAYATATLEELERVTNKYGIRWIVVGELERKSDPASFLQLLSNLTPAFQTGTTSLYAVPARAASQ